VELQEWLDHVTFFNEQIAGLVRAQQTLAAVHDAIGKRRADPVEEDFIFEDAFGRDPNSPLERVIDGVTIQIRILHRRGEHLSDIKGADLLYEIEGHKYVLIQLKRPDARGLVRKDASQLAALTSSCPNPCRYRHRQWPRCGSWVCVQNGQQAHYHLACFVVHVFGNASTRHTRKFRRGLSRSAFDELFAKCWIGAATHPAGVAMLTWTALDSQRAIVSVIQRGAWPRP
jgi:hypothetical protein